MSDILTDAELAAIAARVELLNPGSSQPWDEVAATIAAVDAPRLLASHAALVEKAGTYLADIIVQQDRMAALVERVAELDGMQSELPQLMMDILSATIGNDYVSDRIYDFMGWEVQDADPDEL